MLLEIGSVAATIRTTDRSNLDMIRSGGIHASDLITHVLPLLHVGEAFEVAIDPRRGGMKVVLNSQETPAARSLTR